MLRIPWKGDTIPCHGIPATHSKEAAFIILSNKIFQNCSIVYECMKVTDRWYFSELEVNTSSHTLSSLHWPHLTHSSHYMSSCAGACLESVSWWHSHCMSRVQFQTSEQASSYEGLKAEICRSKFSRYVLFFVYKCILFCSYSRIIQSGKLVPFFSCYHESCQVSRIDGKKKHSKECPHRGHKPGYSNLYIMFSYWVLWTQSQNIPTVRFPLRAMGL